MAAAWELISILGRDTLTDLQVKLGLRHIHIPVDPQPDHPIAEAIGMDNLEKLVAEFGGTSIYIGTRYAAARRNEEVESAIVAGKDLHAVAKRFGIDPNYARSIAKSRRQQIYAARVERDILLGDSLKTVAARYGIHINYAYSLAKTHLRPAFGCKRIRRRAMVQALQRQQQ